MNCGTTRKKTQISLEPICRWKNERKNIAAGQVLGEYKRIVARIMPVCPFVVFERLLNEAHCCLSAEEYDLLVCYVFDEYHSFCREKK